MGAAELLADGSGLLMQFEPRSYAHVERLSDGRYLATFAGTEPNPIQLFLTVHHADGRAG